MAITNREKIILCLLAIVLIGFFMQTYAYQETLNGYTKECNERIKGYQQLPVNEEGGFILPNISNLNPPN